MKIQPWAYSFNYRDHVVEVCLTQHPHGVLCELLVARSGAPVSASSIHSNAFYRDAQSACKYAAAEAFGLIDRIHRAGCKLGLQRSVLKGPRGRLLD
ncbi:hypothetical protein [uncultured Pseudomonas sp.]|uniref:hypothetical protein n=1 Tax=uncultured Pseudomonas sp. TaxID=114707 RepID=UPI0025FAD011|nr:hypothetical protein [uncultured Pseudomonas sp.]